MKKNKDTGKEKKKKTWEGAETAGEPFPQREGTAHPEKNVLFLLLFDSDKNFDKRACLTHKHTHCMQLN